MNKASPHNNDQILYNQNPELTGMRFDVAERTSALNIKTALITAASVVGGLAVGAAIAAVTPLGMIAVIGGGIAGLMAGSSIAQIATLRERTKLKIDEEMVQSYMSGKNHWGAGYRQEVAEHGYGGTQQPHHGGIPNQKQAQEHQR